MIKGAQAQASATVLRCAVTVGRSLPGSHIVRLLWQRQLCKVHNTQLRGWMAEHGEARTRLGALSNLDLQLLCVHDELGRHTKAP